MAPGGQPLVELRGVGHAFGVGALRRQVLFDVAVDVLPGEIVILTGPSGSGKTTLLGLIGALREPQQGTVRVLGRELRGAREQVRVEVRRQIGYVFQAHNLLASLTALRNVQLGLRGLGVGRAEARERSLEALSQVGLGEFAEAHPAQLSGGQRQRVAVARALVRRPRLLLADEPTASLDRASGRAVADLIARLARDAGCAVVLVTHDNRILDVADRLLHMEDGVLSAFAGEVAASTRRMLGAFAAANRRGDVVRQVRDLPFAGFTRLLDGLTHDFGEFLATLELAQGDAFDSMLEQVLEALTLKLGELVGADRATLFVLDAARSELRSQVIQGRAPLHLPVGTGIVGRVAATGEPINAPDARAHPLFDDRSDRETGYRTRSLLTVPIHDSRGAVQAVLQVLNKAGAGAFDDHDQRVLHDAGQAIGAALEVWCRMRDRRGGPATEAAS